MADVGDVHAAGARPRRALDARTGRQPLGRNHLGSDYRARWRYATAIRTSVGIGHDVAGQGLTELSRTIVQVYREVGDDEEIADSTQHWVDGRKVEPTRIIRQYGRNGQDITSQPLYAEDDADEITWYTHDGCVWLHLTRTPRRKWVIQSSEFLRLRTSDHDRRFSTPDEALNLTKERAGEPLIEVTEWTTHQ